MQQTRTAARAWTKQQTRLGRLHALPVVGFSLASVAIAAAQAGCVAIVLTAALAGGHLRLIPALAGFAALALLRTFLQSGAELAAFDAGARGRSRLRQDAVARMLAAGPALLRGTHSADLAASIVDRVEALDGLFARWVPAASVAVLGPALICLCALAVDPFAALVLLLAGLLVPVGQAIAGIGAAAASRGQVLAMARLQARFLDRVRGIATIVLAGRAEDEARALAIAAADLRRRTMRVLRVAFLSSAALDCAMAASLVVLALHYRAALAASPAIAAPTTLAASPQLRTTLSRALFALLLVPEFFAPLRAFAAAYQDRLHAAGAAEALIALPHLPPQAAPATIRTIEARGVALAFENVRLVWDPARGPALDKLSFYVAAGEMLVLAGPSGAGKSSVLELLLGFVRPDEGRILINGHDIADIVPEALSRLTAWIGQKPTLFAASIRDNILFARPDATRAEIEDAARLARVSDFAEALPQGLDTPIGEGGHGLSGGQAQRVAIARAFLKNAPLLLLDEPTAHLDPATESDVLASLKRLAIGRTVVMASHSAAAHAFAGRRLDLRDGRIAAARGAA
jgi:ATP-binding cassette subfamily C protein CydD